MRIAVVGNGKIGGTLAAALASAGHAVAVGVRQPPTPPVGGQPDGAPGPTVTGIEDALTGAEVVILAIPAGAMGALLADHAPALDGRLVIDATNDIGTSGPAHSRVAISAAAPGAGYVRAFNTLGWENFRQPVIAGVQADLFFSSAEADRPLAAQIIADVGLRPVWVGAGAEDVVDGVLALWIALSRHHGRHLAFKLIAED